MPLTPDDVRNKRFTPVRLREGYDMGEVDQFLDQVETELRRLLSENTDLRARLDGGASGESTERVEQSAAPTGEEPPAPPSRPLTTPPPGGETPAPDAPVPPPDAPEPAAPTPAPAEGGTVTEASSAAARLLEIAARNADELLSDAQQQADRIIGDARGEAERLESEARSTADQLESDARGRSERLDQETDERRTELFTGLERERDELEREVDQLRVFEREYRARLKAYFESQLATLEGREDGQEHHLAGAAGESSSG